MENSMKIVYGIAIAAVFVFGVFGTYIISQRGGFSMENMTLLDSAYFTIVTMSTVGYGDITPVTPVARLFVIVLIAIGLSVFLSLVTLISGEFVNSRLERLSERISRSERKKLTGHVVLIGTDGVNIAVAKTMQGSNKKFVIITSDKVRQDRLRETGFKAFAADPTSDVEMSQFELNRAESIILDIRNSSLLVYTLLVIRTLAKGVRTVIVAPNIESARHLKELGLSKNEKVISPNDLAADAIVKNYL